MSSWAKPKYTSTTYKKVHTLKDGDKVQVRILPPMFSMEQKGLFSFTHKQHFGYGTTNRTDPTKMNHKPFYCVERMDFRTKTILQHCPECNKIRIEKDRLDTVKKKLKAEGRSDAHISEATTPISRWLSKHNLDNKQYYNVKFADGAFGTIKFPWTVKKLLDEKIQQLTNPEDKSVQSIDPIDAEQGVWFEVSRSGKGLQTEYRVNVVMENLMVDVGGRTMQVKKEKPAPLTPEDYEAAKEVCYDLADVGIPRLAADRIQMLVDSDGETETVEAVFNTGERTPEASPEPARKPLPPAAKKASSPTVRAAEESPAPVKAQETSAPSAAFVDPADMDEETFRRTFGEE